MKYLSELVCDTKIKFICEDIIFLVCGTDYSQLNTVSISCMNKILWGYNNSKVYLNHPHAAVSK